MKLILAFLLDVILASAAIAQLGAPGSGPGQVLIGDFLWQGKHYLDSVASLADANTVSIQARNEQQPLLIPWEKAPFNVRGKLAKDRQKLIAEQQAIAQNSVKVASEPQIVVQVQQVFDDGVLAAPCREVAGAASADRRIGLGGFAPPPTYVAGDKTIFLSGLANVTDGEKARITVRRDGVWKNGTRTLEKWVLVKRVDKQ